MRMLPGKIASAKRKAVNLSLDTDVVEAARAAGLNLSQISEQVLRAAPKKFVEEQWRADNRVAMAA